MFSAITFDKELNELIIRGERTRAEDRLLNAYSEFKAAGSVKELEHVICRLAHFYSMPGVEDPEKAETYFLEREVLSPGAYTKFQTAMFYFYVLEDFPKTVRKTGEISPQQSVADRSSYYSALTLRGQALIHLKMLSDAGQVLGEILTLIKTDPSGLPYGDEINLLQAAISNQIFVPRCREILNLIIPKIRSQDYVEKAKALLKSANLPPRTE